MGKGSFLKTLGVLGIIGVAALLFFRDQIMVSLIAPIRDGVEKLFSIIPGILVSVGLILLLSGVIIKHGRVGRIIMGMVCVFIGISFSSQGGLLSLFNWFSGERPPPRGWH